MFKSIGLVLTASTRDTPVGMHENQSIIKPEKVPSWKMYKKVKKKPIKMYADKFAQYDERDFEIIRVPETVDGNHVSTTINAVDASSQTSQALPSSEPVYLIPNNDDTYPASSGASLQKYDGHKLIIEIKSGESQAQVHHKMPIPTPRCTTLNRYQGSESGRFYESPIDVPKSFEIAAYQTPFSRNQMTPVKRKNKSVVPLPALQLKRVHPMIPDNKIRSASLVPKSTREQILNLYSSDPTSNRNAIMNNRFSVSSSIRPDSIMFRDPEYLSHPRLVKSTGAVEAKSWAAGTRLPSVNDFRKTALPVVNEKRQVFRPNENQGELFRGPSNGAGLHTDHNQYRLCHRFGGSFPSLPQLHLRQRFCASVSDLNDTKRHNNGEPERLSMLSESRFRAAGKNLKKFFTIDILRRQKPKTTLQDLDGGFFENFGSILRQKSEIQEESLTTPLASLDDSTADAKHELSLRTIDESNENGASSERGSSGEDTDSDSETRISQRDHFIEGSVGWNIEELYEEVLYEILHNIGCDEAEINQTALYTYVQEAFKITNERHEAIMKVSESKEAPEIRLNVEVIEAKDLQPKDPNGLADPFVTIFIASSSTKRYNTSVKSETLDPLWEEHFSLPISENPNDENLMIEVWDFDPAETVREKVNKIFEVKGVRGLRKLMKEIAVTASTGKHDNELIGIASVPLKSIPASGLVMWYSLDKKNKPKRQGLIKVRLNFSSEKNSKVAGQEHRHLLRILLVHELELSKVAPYWWSGKFSATGEAVLTQHSAQSGLGPMEIALAQWCVFASVHCDHPLAFSLFDTTLEKLIKSIQGLPKDDEDVKLFWDGVKKLLPSCFAVIRKIRKKTAGDKGSIKNLSEVLAILSKISMIEPPEGTDLFPMQAYGWIKDNTDEPNWDISNALRQAVHAGADDCFIHITDDTAINDGSDEEKLQNLIKFIQLVRSDLQRSIEYYDKIFLETMNFQYASSLYIFYEAKLAEILPPVVEGVCRNMQRLDISESGAHKIRMHQEINMGTTLFELYLVLKRFAVLGTALAPGNNSLKINQYHQWFTEGVTHWLDISVYKALIRIEKAVELDQLAPVDDTVKYSSSAIDTLAIFYQIKIFWQQLDWPDAEGAFMFVGKIVDDICRCCVYFADQTAHRVEGLGDVQNVFEKKFEVTREWCLAINNIDYIRQSLPQFVNELGVDDIISRLSDCRSPAEAERCADTLKNVMENAQDTERNKILELIETLTKKMSPPMRRFLTEGAELLHQDSNSMDRLMMYMEESLQTLNRELNEVNFERVLDGIWNELSSILYELVQANLDKRRPPSFFSNLRDCLQIMVTSFKNTQSMEKVSSDRECLENIERLLELHGYETSELIHQYYLERLKDQQTMAESPFGILTIRCCFKENKLQIEVMNARNLVPMDTNGLCDSFVRIHFVPEDQFTSVAQPKTTVQNKTLFPLFDEKFSISLTNEQRQNKDAILLLSVKDHDLFGMSNQYIAECYVRFGDIDDAPDTESTEQNHLKLSKPIYKGETDCIRALEYRQGDKQAREFLKKLKNKVGHNS